MLCVECSEFIPIPDFPAKVTDEVEEKEEYLVTCWPARLLLALGKTISVVMSETAGFSGFVSVRRIRKDCCSFLSPAVLPPSKSVPVPDQSCRRQGS